MSRAKGIRIPSWIAFAIVGMTLGAWGAASVFYAFGHRWTVRAPEPISLAEPRPRAFDIRDVDKTSDALDVILDASGWVNGEAPSVGELRGHVVVVDVWADWCPYSAEAAPQITPLASDFEGQGVKFLGLAVCDRARAERIVSENGLPWRLGHDAGRAIESLVDQVGGPTFFVIGKDGRIAWCDGQARYHHDIDGLADDLRAAIVQAVAAG